MPESEDLEAFLVNTETQDHTAGRTCKNVLPFATCMRLVIIQTFFI